MARGKCRWLKYGPPEDLSNGVMDGWSKLGVQATELDRFVQAYTCEKAKLEARRHGHTVRERLLGDGSIRLTVRVGGAV